MKILIVGDGFGFPNGHGATSRVHSYAKGLTESGVSVQVVCLTTTEQAVGFQKNIEIKGSYAGIPFEYVCGATTRPNKFWNRRWLEIKGILGFWQLIRRETQIQNIDAIILYSNSLPLILLTVLIAKLFRAKCVQEKSEFPFVYNKKSLFLRLYIPIFTHTIYKLFDGMIVISTFLEDYFSHLIRKNAKILRIPILVDVEKYNNDYSMIKNETKIVYVGNLGHTEETTMLLKSFAVLAHRHSIISLQIIGDLPKTDAINQLKDLAKKLGVLERVDFTGMVSRDEIPIYLDSATVLVLPRAGGLFSQAGFPTKLGEYLATGKPVVVTGTGDIPCYLEDGVNAYLVPPDNIDAFVKRLDYVLSHPAEAAIVGRHGREVAKQQFDYLINCQRIIKFIRGLL